MTDTVTGKNIYIIGKLFTPVIFTIWSILVDSGGLEDSLLFS